MLILIRNGGTYLGLDFEDASGPCLFSGDEEGELQVLVRGGLGDWLGRCWWHARTWND